MMGISILRQHYQYEVISSQTYSTTIISTIKYDNTKSNVFFIPVHDILEDLEIKNSRGNHLVVLSDRELYDMFGIVKPKLSNSGGNTSRASPDVIPILLPRSDSPYEKIFFTYITPIKRKRYAKSKFSPSINIDFRFKIVPSEFIVFPDKYQIDEKPFDIHILFKSGDDYQIKNAFKLRVYPDKNDNIMPAKQNTIGTYGYFIRDVEFNDVIMGDIDVGLMDSILNTAKIISIIATIIPVILLIVPFYLMTISKFDFDTLFHTTPTIIAISMGMLIGERLWVLRDTFIMKQWIRLQKTLIGFNGFVFVVWFLIFMIALS